MVKPVINSINFILKWYHKIDLFLLINFLTFLILNKISLIFLLKIFQLPVNIHLNILCLYVIKYFFNI